MCVPIVGICESVARVDHDNSCTLLTYTGLLLRALLPDRPLFSCALPLSSSSTPWHWRRLNGRPSFWPHLVWVLPRLRLLPHHILLLPRQPSLPRTRHVMHFVGMDRSMTSAREFLFFFLIIIIIFPFWWRSYNNHSDSLTVNKKNKTSFLCPSRRWGRGEPGELAT